MIVWDLFASCLLVSLTLPTQSQNVFLLKSSLVCLTAQRLSTTQPVPTWSLSVSGDISQVPAVGRTSVVSGWSAGSQGCRGSSCFLRMCDLFLPRHKDSLSQLLKKKQNKTFFHFFFKTVLQKQLKKNRKKKRTTDTNPPLLIFEMFYFVLLWFRVCCVWLLHSFAEFIDFRVISSMGTWCHLPLSDHTV